MITVVNTMRAIKMGYGKADVGGVARYTDDYYFQQSQDMKMYPGILGFLYLVASPMVYCPG